MSETWTKFIEQIRQAQTEAIKKGIKANTVLINKNIGYVKPFSLGISERGISNFPPMICGLETKLTDELPDDYGFAVIESQVTERDKIYQEGYDTAMQEVAQMIKEKSLSELIRIVEELESENAYKNGLQ